MIWFLSLFYLDVVWNWIFKIMTIPDSAGYNYMMENGSIDLPCKPEEERRIVQDLTAKAETSLHEGNLYYVIAKR